MSSFSVNNTRFSYDSCTKSFPDLQPIPWIASQHIYPKVYWKDKLTGTTRIALGSLLCYSEIPQIEQTEDIDLRFFGGIHFPKSAWEDLPCTQFWLPCFEITQTRDFTTLTAHFINQKSSSVVFEQLHETVPLNPLTPCQRVSDLPSFPDWKTNIEYVLSLKQIEKIVLARQTQFTTTNPWSLLQSLEQKAEKATCFAFQFSQESTFLGATPETLFHRRKNILFTEAIAGTRTRGIDEDQLAIELSSSAKDYREFTYVKNFIQAALLPLSSQIGWQKDQVLRTTTLQHLYNKAVVTLNPNCTDTQLLTALHPTPAVCGTPTQEALQLLNMLEPFQRGWYSGAIGWLGTQETDIVVGIRSALVTNSLIKVFAGAGIVQGSDPLKEWEELEAKIVAFQRALS